MSIIDAPAERVSGALGPPALHLIPSAAPRSRDRRAPASPRPAVVCSFHTPDDYYRSHAEQLREQLAGMDVIHEITEVAIEPGRDWADATRRKLAIVRDACRRHPEAMVFWIDVDCRLRHLPEWVRDSTADLIGFQRGFSTPARIGYQGRTRFWEPSFWGVNATEGGRRLVEDAYALEQRSRLKATDDYFLEEAWRANAPQLTFQVIPSTAVTRSVETASDGQFFVFGSSGNVAGFRGRVVQHQSPTPPGPRAAALARVKGIERALPDQARRPLRRAADTVGLTGLLTATASSGIDPERRARLATVLAAGQAGDGVAFARACDDFDDRYVSSAHEAATREVAGAFLAHRDRGSQQTLPLAWWAKPFPGNFGDWLSPWTMAHHTAANLAYQPLTRATRSPHLVAVGSVGRFIRPSSVVVGTGISRAELDLCPSATYVSVRGPITAEVLRRSGGPRVDRFGDPAVLMSRILPIRRHLTNGRIALVRHHSHRGLPVRLPDEVDELPVTMSAPQDIDAFLHQLARYDAVLTSAMHVMVACHSYGIPCGLITFAGHEQLIHGTGIKYEDYARGVDLPVQHPQPIDLDLRGRDLSALIHDVRVSPHVQDEVESHLGVALARTQHRIRAHSRRRHPVRSGVLALWP